jgi:hypothetical protein
MKFLILFLFLGHTLYAESIPFRKLNNGCPLNSDCTKKAGDLWNRWMLILELKENKNKYKKLKEFTKQYGIPFKTWFLPNEKSMEEKILWDSHCKNHRAPQKDILLADIFLKKLSPSKATLYNHALMLDPSGKVIKFKIPRDYTPTLIKNKNLVFNMEEEGQYYGLHISQNGEFKVSQPPKGNQGIFEVKCPSELEKKYTEFDGPKNLYTSRFCHSIWNDDTKKFSTILMGWSCI